jgi:hypothetical protein
MTSTSAADLYLWVCGVRHVGLARHILRRGRLEEELHHEEKHDYRQHCGGESI